MIATKRAYEPATKTDGVRVLVDRLWPRGLRKDEAQLAEWAKDLAPSDSLRRWFGHDPERFREFRVRYRRELAREPARGALTELTRRAARQKVTLVYGARDVDHNNAVVIAQEVAKRIKRRAAR